MATVGSEVMDAGPEFDDGGRLVERPDPLTDGLTAAQWGALAALARANHPWMRRSTVDLIGGKDGVQALEDAGYVESWSTMMIGERRELTRIEKTTDARTGKKRERTLHVGWQPTRARRWTCVALTPRGHALMDRDLFERGDVGLVYQDRRRRDGAGAWMLPDAPIKSSKRCKGVDLCPDQLPDQPDAPAKGRRRAG